MAVPTITSLDPTVGPSMGRALVDIAGTNFRVPTIQATGETDRLPLVSVEVEFDGEPALDVKVVSATRVLALTPIGDPTSVDVLVRNVDELTGIPIPGEEVTSAGAYRYARPKITHGDESDLTRVVRTLLREMKRQVLPEVVLTTHTDYDEATGDELHITKITKVPALILVGPELNENRFYSINERPQIEEGTVDEDFFETDVPYTVDLEFNLIGVSNLTHELLNLLAATTTFFHKNKFLRMDRDASDPAKGRVRYELDFLPEGEPKVATRSSISNIRNFSGRFMIRGFDLEALFGIPSGTLADVPKHEIVDRSRELLVEGVVNLDPTEQIDVSSPIVRSIKSPGGC